MGRPPWSGPPVLPPRPPRPGHGGQVQPAKSVPPRPTPAKDWTEGHTYTDLTRRTLVVDGVSYTAAEVRRLVHDRRILASENTRLRATLKRADRHLKLRTAALIRLIATKGPSLDDV